MLRHESRLRGPCAPISLASCCSIFLVAAEVPGIVSLYSGNPFYHLFLVLSMVPELVFLFFWYPIPSSLLCSGWHSVTSLWGSCVLGFVFLYIWAFVSLFFSHLVHHQFLIPGLLPPPFWNPVPSSCPDSD